MVKAAAGRAFLRTLADAYRRHRLLHAMAIAALLLAAAVGLRTGNMPDFGVLEDYAQYLLFAFWIGGCAFALGSFFHLAQDIVWSGYIGATRGSLGISAFPSMHVAMAVLFALYATRRSRLAGLLMWAFAAIIMVGSVVLGWHYAVDGYASVLISIAIWKACGYFLGKFAPEGVAA
ncbi:hypothetical protein X756_18320 [Mesorhizobium sp. LSHC412B00]|nr:hypothetical protein X756_18320 [Mesorhizobium sp. LSHC412B00]